VNAPPEKVWNQVVAFAGDPAAEGIVVSRGVLRIRFARRLPDTALRGAALHFFDGAVCEPIEVWMSRGC